MIRHKVIHIQIFLAGVIKILPQPSVPVVQREVSDLREFGYNPFVAMAFGSFWVSHQKSGNSRVQLFGLL